jgi:hypothetical protein
MIYLTKSDFKVARTCPTKLYYKKLKYPSLLDEDEYLEFLADGGFMVERMAKLLYPAGQEIGDWGIPEKAFAASQHAVTKGNCVLFEATFIHGNLLARVDILEHRGKKISLIEVKSTSIDTSDLEETGFRGKKGGIRSEWKPYIEDVAFQTLVVRRAFPDYEVTPFLCVVDKAKTATENVTFDKFKLTREKGKRARPLVDYLGDSKRLPKEHILAIIKVQHQVEDVWEEVEAAADELGASLNESAPTKIGPEIGKMCKKCEYRMPCDFTGKNGFAECWGKLAKPEPHILDLYRVDLLGGKNNDLVAELAASGKAALSVVSEDMTKGETGVRQRLQLQYTAKGEEYIAPELPALLRGHQYPLHFIDFEGSRLAVPYHKGMHPYETAAFQWSCHSIQKPGGELKHAAWLNSEVVFPNFEFARTLREVVGDNGTVYIWSPYEKTTLKDVREQMALYGKRDVALEKWIGNLVDEPNRRVVDLCKLAKEYYFHPMMKGRLSIKYVLPAVWTSDAELQKDKLFKRYVKMDKSGNLLNPYDALPPLPVGDAEDIVKEGTGAIRAYQEMMFGFSASDPEAKAKYRQLLLQYCELDTAAMVMIWLHWCRKEMSSK